WFRKNPEMTKYYIDKRWDYYELYSRDWLAGLEAVIVEYSKHAGLSPSEEYGSYIIDSIVTGTPRVIYGNVKNDGLITNLPTDACVEVACLVDQHGVRPVKYGDLPAVCAALNNVQVNIHRLAVEAALSGDRRLVYATLALDPLTGLHCTLPQIREMADRMFDALAPWLPQFQPS
ncbi:MAG: alpha-glucosidase/alpha-galactosidase, partial [Actinomycetota bacterium]